MRNKENTNTATVERNAKPEMATRQASAIVTVEESNPLIPFEDQIGRAKQWFDAEDTARVAQGKKSLAELDHLDVAERLAASTLKRYIKITRDLEKSELSESELEAIAGEQQDLDVAVRRRNQLALSVNGVALGQTRIARRRVLKRDGFGVPDVMEVTVKGQSALSWTEKADYAEKGSANFQKAAAYYRKREKSGR